MILVTSRKKTDHKAVELMDLMGMGFSMGQVINGILIFGEINILYQGLPAILGYHPGRVLTDVKTRPTRCGRDIPKSIGPCWMPRKHGPSLPSLAEHLGNVASLDVSF